MFIDYLSYFKNATEECERFKESVIDVYFNGGKKQVCNVPFFVLLPDYQEDFLPVKKCTQLYRILGLSALGKRGPNFYRAASYLDDNTIIRRKEDFTINIDLLIVSFKFVRDEIAVFCSAFDEEEKERINEAIHNHLEGCNYSCVAMSVSAVESRLLKLMCIASHDSKPQLEKKTLGQLIVEYIDNKSRYKNVVPEKHEHLLGLSNTYRIFSVHPKKQRITGRLASSIFNLAIEFLTDPNSKPAVVQAKLTTSEEAK